MSATDTVSPTETTSRTETIQVITTRTCKVWRTEAGIVRTVFLPGAQELLEDAKANTVAYAALSDGKRCALLVDLHNLRSQHRAVRAYYAGPECAKVVAATALLTHSIFTKMAANFYMGFNKPLFPTRMFTSEAEAIAWLSGFVPAPL